MKSKSADKIKMPSIDELLGVSGEESATDIEISRIHSFANHPFKVLDDDKMDDLVESIKQNGVLTPVLVRPDKNSSYEMISGHRRMHAAIKAGLETIPAIVPFQNSAQLGWNYFLMVFLPVFFSIHFHFICKCFFTWKQYRPLCGIWTMMMQ